MDVHLDNLEGQENTSNMDKEKDSTGDKQDVAMRTDSPEMTDVEHHKTDVITSFAASARTGRRNAVPDIQGSTSTSELSELPLKMENLSLKKGNNSQRLKNQQRVSLSVFSFGT
ncbi:cAMP-dependent protein kinase inhibitor beta [Galemys pyrenaicus]|uniref:cAMP-dependent protein kinase inhibitor beta n=1 Tax=Galemys pyrenaicus TaxID=202257 RepID=A0A8J6DJY1_GALPY|nr:cAMP-dependent protein kinase inhibitor beta [Galemys pyrenaicus]